jgi:hypothetical protein
MNHAAGRIGVMAVVALKGSRGQRQRYANRQHRRCKPDGGQHLTFYAAERQDTTLLARSWNEPGDPLSKLRLCIRFG